MKKRTATFKIKGESFTYSSSTLPFGTNGVKPRGNSDIACCKPTQEVVSMVANPPTLASARRFFRSMNK